nr:RNA-directed DNA polymerase, eukaryota [Tanacetum cinerariifolium]
MRMEEEMRMRTKLGTDLIKLMIEVYCLRNEIHKLENELWNLSAKGTDIAGYTRWFQELALLYLRMVPEEEDKIKRWICDLSGDGEFRVKEVRNFLDNLFLPSYVDAMRWVKYIPIKINVFVWRARRDFLPTRVNLSRRGALDTHKLIPRRSPWQDAILAIHSLQSKGINRMDFIQKKVGNGENISFWDDSWLGEVELKVLYKRLYALEMCKPISVAERIGHPSLSHSFRKMPRGGVEQENYDLLCSKVTNLVLPNISDRWCWSLKGSQEFSVKSSRILIDNTILPNVEVLTRWIGVVPIKVNVHAWRVCLDKLPTRANLSLRGMDISSIAYPHCNSAVARQVWRKFLIWWELEDVAFNSYNEWLICIVNIRLHKQLKVFLEVLAPLQSALFPTSHFSPFFIPKDFYPNLVDIP